MVKAKTRPLGESIPPLKDHGVTDLVAAHKGGVAMQSVEVTQGGGTTAIVFADLNLADMADASYHVYVGGEPVTTAPYCDLSTRATTGFDLINGTAAEVVHLLIVGRLAGMAPDPSDL